jgi:hypothetical protein
MLTRMPPEVQLVIALGREFDLSQAVNPTLTYQIRGQLAYRTRFRAQVSTDGGLAWSDLASLNYEWNQDWTRVQVPLTTYTNGSIRLRFIVWSEYSTAPDQDLFLDNIGIGEPTPGAPTLSSPRDQGIVGVLRPTLVVSNAVDYQSDPLSYRFEVYSDPDMSNIVAQVPVVASGTHTTAWQVDVNLIDHGQYWWRCQAAHDTNLGPWMVAASFYLNHTNRPPMVVQVPGSAVILTDTDGVLTWYPTTDPDLGDSVTAYQVQVDDDPFFGSPTVNDPTVQLSLPEALTPWLSVSIPLHTLAGVDQLQFGTGYYWRVRAMDSYFAWSAWSTGDHWLRLGMQAPEAPRLTAMYPPDAHGLMRMGWSPTERPVYVEFKPSLQSTNWQTIAGPLSGYSHSVTNDPAKPMGFFRLRQE